MEGSVKILCVDDEENVLRSLRRLFMDDDYELFTAVSAEAGLEILGRGEAIPVVISDYRMPGMNGVHFLSEVCRNWPETVRIVLSGYADTAAVVEAINLGQIYKFIPKPWNDDELRITIQNAVATYELKKKNRQLMEDLRYANEQLQKVNEDLGEAIAINFLQALRQQTQKIYQQTLDAIPMGVMAFDAAGYVKHINPAAHNIIGDLDKKFFNKAWSEVLPKALHASMEELLCKGSVSSPWRPGSRNGWIMGGRIKLEGQSGLFLAFDTEGFDSSELPLSTAGTSAGFSEDTKG